MLLCVLLTLVPLIIIVLIFLFHLIPLVSLAYYFSFNPLNSSNFPHIYLKVRSITSVPFPLRDYTVAFPFRLFHPLGHILTCPLSSPNVHSSSSLFLLYPFTFVSFYLYFPSIPSLFLSISISLSIAYLAHSSMLFTPLGSVIYDHPLHPREDTWSL